MTFTWSQSMHVSLASSVSGRYNLCVMFIASAEILRDTFKLEAPVSDPNIFSFRGLITLRDGNLIKASEGTSSANTASSGI
jgi:hypothetical protein